MAEKAKRIKIRRSWGRNPATRVKKSKRKYSRQERKRVERDEVKTWASEG